MNSSEPVGSQRPGGRAARVRRDVHAAVLGLLVEVGYADLAVDEVARRAGVHKTTVYRRWPAKADLVLDAVLQASGESLPVPDTGSLAEDLRLLARGVVVNLTTEPGASLARALISASLPSAELTEAMARYWSERFALAQVMVERATDRGELASSPVGAVPPDLVIESLIGPLWVRFLLTDRTIDNALADRTAALVAAGLGLTPSTSATQAAPPH